MEFPREISARFAPGKAPSGSCPWAPSRPWDRRRWKPTATRCDGKSMEIPWVSEVGRKGHDLVAWWIFMDFPYLWYLYWSLLIYLSLLQGNPFLRDYLEHTCAADSWWRGMLLGSIGVGAVWETKDYLLLWSVVNVDVFVQETYRRFPVSLHQMVVDESLEC